MRQHFILHIRCFFLFLIEIPAGVLGQVQPREVSCGVEPAAIFLQSNIRTVVEFSSDVAGSFRGYPAANGSKPGPRTLFIDRAKNRIEVTPSADFFMFHPTGESANIPFVDGGGCKLLFVASTLEHPADVSVIARSLR